ncbi:adenosylcobyric acid synthase [Paenibacillus forsythiae]|uniref:Cobyric acid synthase n=1 Tax=Paenibacillus forsythiae TaxID=365616 RepID=A0ABU3HDQ0_9BACL|nr:cobyric acid synthase [Paenibacillus forsythiae]MDT3428931.1 adenosylcobyric acid synthase [Paenibacillus forsythiae]
MFQGTASDVGKSIITTAVCRIFVQDGFKTAPYKSQNMALNSYVTLCGKEIGRAQGVQAEACGIIATTDMNPILIKPTRDMTAQVVVHGRPHAEMSARRYREEYLPIAEAIVREALDRLKSGYDAVVIEGAGSPAEINLKDRDIVNMRLAEWADAPVVLVADIDRGGVFASIVGTLELLEPHERSRVKGFIINKFRGDVTILQPGLDWLEQRTGIPVLGVIPFLNGIDIEAEDSVALDHQVDSPNPAADIDIAIIRLPRISNFTDTDPLGAEPDVRVRYVQSPGELGNPDVILLPGTKNTLADLGFLRESGLADAVRNKVESGARLVGICGGYQMLGARLSDPHQVESEEGEAAGLGYLPAETVFYPDKRTQRVSGTVTCNHPEWLKLQGISVEGYEIHMGRTEKLEPVNGLFQLGGHEDGILSVDGRVWGTYLHGIFENDAFRRKWLNLIRQEKGLAPLQTDIHFRSRKTAAFDRLADHVRAYLDIDQIYRIAGLK